MVDMLVLERGTFQGQRVALGRNERIGCGYSSIGIMAFTAS
jgi:hypothetical protein